MRSVGFQIVATLRSERMHDAALRLDGSEEGDVSHDLGGFGRVERRFHGGPVAEVDNPNRDQPGAVRLRKKPAALTSP